MKAIRKIDETVFPNEEKTRKTMGESRLFHCGYLCGNCV